MGDEVKLYRIAKRLRALDRRMDNLIPVWPKVGAYIARENRKAMATRGASVGAPWKPLQKATIEQKLLHGWGRTPLVRTRQMQREFTGRPMGVETYSAHSATFGTASKVAVYQTKGTHRNGKRAIPPRRIQHLKHGDKKEIARIVTRYLFK